MGVRHKFTLKVIKVYIKSESQLFRFKENNVNKVASVV